MLKRLRQSKINILTLAIISLLVFIPLYPKFPLFNVPGTYVAVRLEDLLVAVVLAIWFLLEAKTGFLTFKERISRLILLYFGIGAVTVFNALVVTKVVVPHLVLLHYLRRIEYMSLFFVAFVAVRKRKEITPFFVALFVTTIGVFIYGIGQKFFNWPVISTMNKEFSKGMVLYLTEWTRINSTFAGHYDLAVYAVLIICLSAGFIIGVKKKGFKFLGLILALLVFYLLLLTASRISFAAYLIAIIFVLIFARKKAWIAPVIIFSLVGMIWSQELGQRYLVTFKAKPVLGPQETEVEEQELPTPTLEPEPTPVSGEVKKPIPTAVEKKKKKVATIAAFPTPEPIEIATQRSGEIRFKVEWPRSLKAFTKNPLLGTGYSSVTLATDNDYLRTLAETGILGLGSLLLIFLEITKELIAFLKKKEPVFERAVVFGIAGGMVGFLANALFIDVFEASKIAFIFWILTGSMMGLIRQQQPQIKV